MSMKQHIIRIIDVKLEFCAVCVISKISRSCASSGKYCLFK